MFDLTEEITQTVLKIQEAAQAYYTGQAIMTDSEFDRLVDHLRDIDPQNKVLSLPGWGFNPEGEKTPHLYGEIGSLPKFRDYGALIMRFANTDEIITAPKLDGLSCVMYFDNNKYMKSVTRGNGREGIAITSKMPHILKDLDIKKATEILTELIGTEHFGVRGELVISKSNWLALKETAPEYKNSRNAVAGIINSKEVNPEILKYVDFVPYKIQVHGSNVDYGHLPDYRGVLDILEKAGFIAIKKRASYCPIEVDNMYKIICNYDYPCDGTVVTNNYLKTDEKGYLMYDQVAFKFEDEKAESRVIDISWNLTRTGKMTPVANIEPVELDGATVKRVTCFNARFVKENRVGPNAVIEIQRSGQVIPDIQRVIEECLDYEEYIPTKCPSCGHDLVMRGADLVCVNRDCEASAFGKLYNWIDWNGKVKGMSYASICEFIDITHLETISDIYQDGASARISALIDNADLGRATRNKYDETLVNLYSPMDPRKFLGGLGIKGLGWNTAELIVKNKHVFEMLTSGTLMSGAPVYDTSEVVQALYQIKGIGFSVVEAILDKLDLIDFLSNKIDFLQIEEPKATTGKVRKFCVTGSLNMGSRSQFCEHVKQFGWEMADIKDAEVLVTNKESNSSKFRKARELGKKIISEEEFLKLIK